MKRLLLVLILTLSFQTLTKADDIRDFEIEGMSIGDSALKYFSKREIKMNKKNWYKDTKFYGVQITSQSEKFDAIQLHFKTGDKTYIIHSVGGLIDFSNNPNLIQTPWLIKGKENLSDFFNSILNPSKEHLSYQETCLNRLLYRGKSCKKLINTLYQISKNPPPYILEEKFLFDQYNIEPRKNLDFDQNDLRAYILDAYSKQNDLNVKTLQILMTRINEFTNDTRHYKEISKQHIHSFLKRIHDFVDFYK